MTRNTQVCGLALWTVLATFLPCATLAQAEAWDLWRKGQVHEAAIEATKSLGKDSNQAHHILLLTSFAQGKFENAIEHQAKIDESYVNYSKTIMPTVDAYQHLGRYRDAHNFAAKHLLNKSPELVAALKELAGHPPLFELGKTTIVPFKTQHPLNPYLPAFDMDLNGHPVTAHVDTGGTFLVISQAFANELGLQYTYYADGNCNNRPGKIWFTQTNIKLGDLRVQNIPTLVSDCINSPQTKDLVIFGTNVLQRLLSTLDYPKNRLVLSPFSERASHEAEVQQGYSQHKKQPFFIWGDHYMFARGAISGATDLNFFIDTGLVSFHSDGRQAAFFTSTKNLLNWGYGQDGLKTGSTTEINGELSLGNLSQANHIVKHQEAIAFDDFGGVEIHGLIGHAFLKRYSWTIDFERMQYTFRE